MCYVQVCLSPATCVMCKCVCHQPHVLRASVSATSHMCYLPASVSATSHKCYLRASVAAIRHMCYLQVCLSPVTCVTCKCVCHQSHVLRARVSATATHMCYVHVCLPQPPTCVTCTCVCHSHPYVLLTCKCVDGVCHLTHVA